MALLMLKDLDLKILFILNNLIIIEKAKIQYDEAIYKRRNLLLAAKTKKRKREEQYKYARP